MIIFESSLPQNYREAEIKQILSLVTVGKSCQIISLPGGGKATILKLLAHNHNLITHHLKEDGKNIMFFYLNLLELSDFDEDKIFSFLSTNVTEQNRSGTNSASSLKNFVNKNANSGKTIVFLFDHFDEYHAKLPKSFFRLLQDLKSTAKYKFSAVFATRRDLAELLDQEILKDYYEFFMDNKIYSNIKDNVASNLIIDQTEEIYKTKISKELKKQIITLTGGHAKLTKLVAELAAVGQTDLSPDILIQKPLIKSALQEIYQSFTAQEQKELTKIATGSAVSGNETVKQLERLTVISSDMKLTIPLLETFVKIIEPTKEKIIFARESKEIKKGDSVISELLSKQEYRFLKYLCENEGKLIEREEIISVVWPDSQVKEGISNEAIDQMIFRLRKKIEENPNSPQHISTIKGQGWRFKS